MAVVVAHVIAQESGQAAMVSSSWQTFSTYAQIALNDSYESYDSILSSKRKSCFDVAYPFHYVRLIPPYNTRL